MTLPKLTGLEHTAVIVAAAGAGALLLAAVAEWVLWLAVAGGLGVFGVSFWRRQGWIAKP